MEPCLIGPSCEYGHLVTYGHFILAGKKKLSQSFSYIQNPFNAATPFQSFCRLQVVPLSLRFVVRDAKKIAKIMDVTRSFFRAVFFRVTHNGLSERGTTRSVRLLRPVGDWMVVVNYIFTFLVAQLLCSFFFPFSFFLFLLSYWSRLQLQVRLQNLNFWSRERHPDIICFGANKHSVVFCVSKVLVPYILHPHVYAKCKH